MNYTALIAFIGILYTIILGVWTYELYNANRYSVSLSNAYPLVTTMMVNTIPPFEKTMEVFDGPVSGTCQIFVGSSTEERDVCQFKSP